MTKKEMDFFPEIIGKSQSMKVLKDRAYKVAQGNSTILITGETGTGKGLLAKSIHEISPRSSGNFVEVNCGAIPENLIESELFGYTKGSFTGALREGKKGRFLMADGGSIFLDEIGEMPLHLQVKLLHVLQSRTVEPIGATKSIAVDLRVIAATNQDLEELIKERKFRKDLYFRLGVVPLKIPALRERKEDIPLLAKAIFQKYCRKLAKESLTLENEVVKAFLAYDWPGNVRELENVIEYGINMTTDNSFSLHELPETFITDKCRLKKERVLPNHGDHRGTYQEQLQRWETALLLYYLDLYGDDGEGKKQIAKALDISVATLYRKLSIYQIGKED